MEAAYHDAAKAVLDGRASTAGQVFRKLEPIYVQDEKFESDFAQATIATSGQRRRIAKYILCNLECDASGRGCDFATDPGTIEHILPENPAGEWEEMFPRELWDQSVYRIGNLTLLKASANREVGSGTYAEKVAAYEGSEYELTRKIPEFAPDEWTRARLISRQQYLARRAAHIWKADYA